MKKYIVLIFTALLFNTTIFAQPINEQEKRDAVPTAVSENTADFFKGNRSNGDLTFGSEFVFNSGTSNYISSTAIDDTHFIAVYRDDDNSDYGTAISVQSQEVQYHTVLSLCSIVQYPRIVLYQLWMIHIL